MFLLCFVNVQGRHYFWLMEFIKYLLHARHFENYHYTHFTGDETKAQKDTHVKKSELSLGAWIPGAFLVTAWHLSESQEVPAEGNVGAGLHTPCS